MPAISWHECKLCYEFWMSIKKGYDVIRSHCCAFEQAVLNLACDLVLLWYDVIHYNMCYTAVWDTATLLQYNVMLYVFRTVLLMQRHTPRVEWYMSMWHRVLVISCRCCIIRGDQWPLRSMFTNLNESSISYWWMSHNVYRSGRKLSKVLHTSVLLSSK